MADEETPSGGGLWGIVVIIVVILIIGVQFEGVGLLGTPVEQDQQRIDESRDPETGFSITRFLGKGDLTLGHNIINLGDTRVRNLPGGGILGIQDKFTVGKLVDGPANKFGTIWWRVNYENAPSGWVEAVNLSTKIGMVKSINVIPRFISGWKPFGYFLVFVLIFVLIFVKILGDKENAIEAKRRKVTDEQAFRNKQRLTGAEAHERGTGIDGLPIQENSGAPAVMPHEDFSQPVKNQKWEHVQKLIDSQNQNDWRQAVIEADIMLDEMLRRMGYEGKSIGDMLKQVERSDFATLDKAWEAHKFRNEIAHTGSEFAFSRNEAERVFKLFKEVFDEFYYI